MKLTYANGIFVLYSSDGTKSKTLSLKAAARFRKHADDSAQKVFNKLLLKSLPFPSGRRILAPEGLKLMDFQKDMGIPFYLTRNRSYMAHDPGLGKSAQVIAAVGVKPGRTLIICPSFLRVNWARQITLWYKDDFPRISMIEGTPKKDLVDWGADFIICPDSMLDKEWVNVKIFMTAFRHIIIDESHRFKTFDAARTVALFGGKIKNTKYKSLIYNAEHVCALSGTPMPNRAIELWPLLYAMAPETIDFMSYQDFGFRYGGAWQDEQGRWLFTGSSREEELNERLTQKFMQRIAKDDVLDLPEKIRELVFVDTDNRKKEVIDWDKQLQKYLANSDYENQLEELGEYAVVRHETGLAKVDFVVEFYHNVFSQNEKEQVILYAHHRDVVERLAQKLLGFLPRIINGDTPQKEKTKTEDLFQAGKCKLIIGNISAMNLGLTLTKATRIGFIEYSPTPSDNVQAEDRGHRIGLDHGLLCQYFVLPASLDEHYLELILKKQERIKKVIG